MQDLLAERNLADECESRDPSMKLPVGEFVEQHPTPTPDSKPEFALGVTGSE
jgi:hypothetical protein